MQIALVLLSLLMALPVSAACPPLIPAENLWQLTAGVYCLASKIDFEIETLECSFIEGVCSCVDASTSVLSTLDELILSDVDSVSSKVDVLLECTLGTQITQAMIPYTINQPGHYYLCDSVSSTGAHAITLNANDVYLNLNGFTVSSTDRRAITTAGGSYSNVTIENGSVSSAASLFRVMEVSGITNFTVRNVAMTGTLLSVCFLASITDLVMEDCYVTASGVGGNGIEALSINGGRIENVNVYNVTLNGIQASTASSNTTLELINCVVAAAVFGFELVNGAGIILRDCIASGCAVGYRARSGHLLENCVAHDNTANGFLVEGATSAVLRNCVATSTTGEGFRLHVSSEVLCEGCISKNNDSAGFDISSADGGNTDCVFDHCLSLNNGTFGFFVNDSFDTRIINCVASGNALSGIFNTLGSTGTFIVDSRSEHGVTAVNPAYNLNGAVNTLNAAVEVIIS